MIADIVSTLANMPIWLVVIMVIVLMTLLLTIVFVLIRTQNRPDSAKKKPKSRKKRDHDPTGMVRACRQFHRTLQQAFPGASARYRLPLFVAVGPSRNAISSVVQGAGLVQPLGEAVSSGGLTWTAFDRAAVVEVDPDILKSRDDKGDRWRNFIRLLQRFRPQRPVDGVILVLPAADLLGGGEDVEARRRQAERLREALAEMENRLLMTVPIHCVIAGAETLDGFKELGQVIPPYQFERPLGYASPYGSKEVYRPEFVEQALQYMVRRTQMLALEALTVEHGAIEADALFTFPSGLERLKPELTAFLDTVLQPGHYARLTALRGIYLTGLVKGGRSGAAQQKAFAAGALSERIFPEYSLAEPTGGRWVAANRDVRRAQVAVGVLLVVVGTGLYAQDRILANRVPQLRSLVSAVSKDFRRVSIARYEGGSAAKIFRSDSAEFIQRMSAIDGDYLRSILVPSSWFGQLPRDLERLQTAAYVEILFKSISRSLAAQAKAVTSDSGGTRGRARHRDEERPYPDYTFLKQKLAAYSRLTTQLRHYQRLRKGNRDAFALRSLTKYLYDVELPDGFFPQMDMDVLGARGLTLKKLQVDRFSDQAGSSFLEVHNQFIFDLTTRDRIPNRLRKIRRILSERENLFGEEGGSVGRLRQLYGQLNKLQSLFEGNRYTWIVREDVPISTEFSDILVRISESLLLGEKVATHVQRQVTRARRQFREELTGIEVRNFGQIVVMTRNGLRLTPSAQRVRERLKSFGMVTDASDSDSVFSNGVSGQGIPRRMPHPRPTGTYIHWRIDELEEGQRLLDSIEARTEGNSQSQSVERALDEVVQQEKLDAIVTSVRQAVTEKSARGGSLVNGGGSETALQARVDNFIAARDQIDDFLLTLRETGAHALHRNLLRLMGWEAEKIIAIADEILQENDLYVYDRNALAAWEGQANMANRLFDVRSRSGLVAYLAQQRARLRTLAQEYAQPALAFLYDHASHYQPDRLEKFARWRIVLENLQRYRNKTPGNSIRQLEEYVVSRLNTVTLSDCTAAQPSQAIHGDGYIANRLRAIADAAGERCLALKQQNVRERYAELANRFNSDLAGRRPFVAAGDDAAAAAPVQSAELIRFLQSFDRGMNTGLGEPRFWGGEAKAERVLGFLDRIDRVVQALRPAIEAEDGQPKLTYTVIPAFRVNREAEIGGNHIIDWSLTFGDTKRSLLTAGEGVAWTAGDPVTVAFKWAKDAPSRPSASGDAAGLSVQDRTARFQFSSPWSLMAMIARHGTRDGGNGAHRLRFDIPVTYRGAGDGAARLEGGQARVFIRLRLQAQGQTIRLPAFPSRAPVPQVSQRSDSES